MNPGYAIRKARPGDAGTLPEVERSAGRAFLEVPSLAWLADDDVQSVELHAKLIAEGNAWVAVDDRDMPVGFLNAEQVGESLHILLVAVRYDCQRRGIGRALMECVRADAKQRGMTTLSLTTFRDVAWNRPFYELLGFQVLADDGMPAHLRAVLDEEAAHGIPVERRCAMVCPLDRT